MVFYLESLLFLLLFTTYKNQLIEHIVQWDIEKVQPMHYRPDENRSYHRSLSTEHTTYTE